MRQNLTVTGTVVDRVREVAGYADEKGRWSANSVLEVEVITEQSQ